MPGYAAFAATHRERLVRSLVAETGLPRATAQSVADDVLARAWDRGITAPDGAAYGWLRVAARHRAAEPESAWADAADAAVLQARAALAAIATLPDDDRALLRLRYAEGLLPAALAARLGTTVPDVLARLDRAWSTATTGLLPRRRSYVRPVAAAAVGVAALVTFLPAATTRPALPAQALGRPSLDLTLPGAEPVEAAAHTTPLAPVTYQPDAVLPPAGTRSIDDAVAPDRTPPSRCAPTSGCLDSKGAEEIRIALPDEVAHQYGSEHLVIPTGSTPVDVCETLPAPPSSLAECVPAGRG